MILVKLLLIFVVHLNYAGQKGYLRWDQRQASQNYTDIKRWFKKAFLKGHDCSGFLILNRYIKFKAMDNSETYKVPSTARIGHIHLKVADLERALDFYHGILGFDVTQRMGDSAAFLSAGGYHHHIGLNTWHSKGAPEAPRNAVGLYHTAILYDKRKDLAQVLRRLLDAEYPLTGAADHGVSEAIYLNDPDGNGIELYYDRSRNEWPRDREGGLAMFTRALHLEDLLAELNS